MPRGTRYCLWYAAVLFTSCTLTVNPFILRCSTHLPQHEHVGVLKTVTSGLDDWDGDEMDPRASATSAATKFLLFMNTSSLRCFIDAFCCRTAGRRNVPRIQVQNV